MKEMNSADRVCQLAAELAKRLEQLNLHRRELERRLHVANGFFNQIFSGKKTTFHSLSSLM